MRFAPVLSLHELLANGSPIHSHDELEGAVIEELLMTSDECRLCHSVVPFVDVNAHMATFHRTNGWNMFDPIGAAEDDIDFDDVDPGLDLAHGDPDVYQCAFCEHVGTCGDDIDAHVRAEHAPADPTLYCEFCALRFHTDVRLEAHRRSEHDQK